MYEVVRDEVRRVRTDEWMAPERGGTVALVDRCLRCGPFFDGVVGTMGSRCVRA